MKNILVIYYTQTGQLDKAVKATLAPLQSDSSIQIDYTLITPKTPYPYPWSYMQFFDVFPETVHGIACELNPITIDKNKNYDLVIIAYQPWFLSVCIPINSFLQTKEAKQIFKNKPVVTILACRNMWLNGQEKMKQQLLNLEAHLVGNITYVDKSANLISLITVLAFVLGGVKEKFMGIFPKYGVSDADLQSEAPKFGEIIKKHLRPAPYYKCFGGRRIKLFIIVNISDIVNRIFLFHIIGPPAGWHKPNAEFITYSFCSPCIFDQQP